MSDHHSQAHLSTTTTTVTLAAKWFKTKEPLKESTHLVGTAETHTHSRTHLVTRGTLAPSQANSAIRLKLWRSFSCSLSCSLTLFLSRCTRKNTLCLLAGVLALRHMEPLGWTDELLLLLPLAAGEKRTQMFSSSGSSHEDKLPPTTAATAATVPGHHRQGQMKKVKMRNKVQSEDTVTHTHARGGPLRKKRHSHSLSGNW